mmetsp:Transcript_18183/g.30543  ORF Transcript_18183/g.30543 Transcript_18183/m.30543 type:complete len:104 (-) Transcript_18183:1316-1627(-)
MGDQQHQMLMDALHSQYQYPPYADELEQEDLQQQQQQQHLEEDALELVSGMFAEHRSGIMLCSSAVQQPLRKSYYYSSASIQILNVVLFFVLRIYIPMCILFI